MGLISRVSSRTYRSKMITKRRNFLFLLSLSNVICSISADEECVCRVDLGFDKDALNCKTCEEMKEFDLSNEMIDECKKCCQNPATQSEQPKYSKIELHVCS